MSRDDKDFAPDQSRQDCKPKCSSEGEPPENGRKKPCTPTRWKRFVLHRADLGQNVEGASLQAALIMQPKQSSPVF